MPRIHQSAPSYRLHRASGQAVVTIQGMDRYLGPHGSKSSKLEYDRIVGEWLAAGRPAGFQAAPTEITVVEILAGFKRFALSYYVKNNRPSGTFETYKPISCDSERTIWPQAGNRCRPLGVEVDYPPAHRRRSNSAICH